MLEWCNADKDLNIVNVVVGTIGHIETIDIQNGMYVLDNISMYLPGMLCILRMVLSYN